MYGLGWTSGNVWFNSRQEQNILVLPSSVQDISEAHSKSYTVCIGDAFTGLKRQVRENYPSFSSSAEVTNNWRNKSTPPYEVTSLPVLLLSRTHDASNNAVS